MNYIVPLISLCWLLTCPSPTVPPKKAIKKPQIQLVRMAKQGEKVWVSVSGFKSKKIVRIDFGDKAYTEPSTDVSGSVKTWHTYGCLQDADTTDYIVTVSQSDTSKLQQSLKIVCRIPTSTPTLFSTPTPKKKNIFTVTSTPTPVKTNTPVPTFTVVPTRKPSVTVTPSQQKSIMPTRSISRAEVFQENNRSDHCADLKIVVSTSLYGRIITLPYEMGKSSNLPIYDTGAISADQMIEYRLRFVPVAVKYAQTQQGKGDAVYEMKEKGAWISHFYLNGFYSANHNLMRSVAVVPVDGDTITQVAYTTSELRIQAKTNRGELCGIKFRQTYDAPAHSSAYDPTITQEGNKPKKYILQ